MDIPDKEYLMRKVRNLSRNLELRWGFTELNPSRKHMEITEDNWVPFLKKKSQGAEKIYVKDFYLKYRRKKTVYVCTSALQFVDDINEEDYVWILEKEEGNPVKFFWFPILRSENFVQRVLEYVEMYVEHVKASPLCEECGEELYLAHYPGVMHLMAYVCGNNKYIHQRQNKVPYAVFDNPNLPDKISLRMFNRYQQFYKNEYNRYVADPNKTHKPARITRYERKKVAQESLQQTTNYYNDIRNNSDDYNDGAHLE